MGKEILPHGAIAEYTDFSEDISLMRGSRMARNIYVVDEGSGSLQLIMGDGTDETLTGLAVGAIEPGPFYSSKIVAAGTDVTKIRVGW